jgi:hypothetical protein
LATNQLTQHADQLQKPTYNPNCQRANDLPAIFRKEQNQSYRSSPRPDHDSSIVGFGKPGVTHSVYRGRYPVVKNQGLHDPDHLLIQ